MACNLTKGRKEPCKDVVGGIKAVYFIDYGVSVTKDGVDTDVVEDIQTAAGSGITAFKYEVKGNSSFCLPFICKTSNIKKKLEKYLSNNGVETRPLCSGNLLRQPFLQRVKGIPSADKFPLVEKLHENGFFIGNNHLIEDSEFIILDNLIQNFINEN